MFVYLALLVALIFTVAAQLLMKAGMNKIGTVELSAKSFFNLIPQIFTTPYLLLGLASLGAGFILWLIVLSRMKLSVAIPFTSLNYALILLFSWLVLKESVSAGQMAGIALIVAGLFLVTR